MSELSEPETTPPISRAAALRILSDCASGLVAVAAIVITVTGLLDRLVPTGWVVGLGIWTAVVGTGALPALGLLLVAPPRIPLRERSALFASASWFGRAVWASALFSLSIIIGAIAGVLASQAVEIAPEFDLQKTIEHLAMLVLWPTVLLVTAIAYVIMGIRWLRDLGAIIADDHGSAARMLLEKRWGVSLGTTLRHKGLVDGILELSVGLLSRVALFLTMATVGAIASAYVASW